MHICEISLNKVANLQKIDHNLSPIDRHFESLQLDEFRPGTLDNVAVLIPSVDRASEEYKHLSGYLHSTHGSTHDWYTLDIVSIFRVKRRAEDERWIARGWYDVPGSITADSARNSYERDSRWLLWHVRLFILRLTVTGKQSDERCWDIVSRPPNCTAVMLFCSIGSADFL